jgi:hypothetical protein
MHPTPHNARRAPGKALLWRLLLALVAASLLLVSMAYYLTDNLVHEIIGGTMLVVVIGHNVLHRRWYAAIPRTARNARSRLNLVVTLMLLAAMLTLLVTSVLISNTLFAFLSLEANFGARQVHVFAAYLVLIVVAIHLGFRWPTIMNAARQRFRLTTPSVWRTRGLRLLAVAIALQGIRSSFELDVGTKLTMQASMDWWDFEASVAGFFLHALAVMGFYTVVTYGGLAWWHRRSASPRLQRHRLAGQLHASRR